MARTFAHSPKSYSRKRLLLNVRKLMDMEMLVERLGPGLT